MVAGSRSGFDVFVGWRELVVVVVVVVVVTVR